MLMIPFTETRCLVSLRMTPMNPTPHRHSRSCNHRRPLHRPAISSRSKSHRGNSSSPFRLRVAASSHRNPIALSNPSRRLHNQALAARAAPAVPGESAPFSTKGTRRTRQAPRSPSFIATLRLAERATRKSRLNSIQCTA